MRSALSPSTAAFCFALLALAALPDDARAAMRFQRLLLLAVPLFPAAIAIACGGGNENLPPPPPPPAPPPSDTAPPVASTPPSASTHPPAPPPPPPAHLLPRPPSPA